MKKIRKAVMNNLIERNKHLDPNKEYWSMQLLMKLGVIPDVEEVTGTKDSLSPTQTKAKINLGNKSSSSPPPKAASVLKNTGNNLSEFEKMAL